MSRIKGDKTKLVVAKSKTDSLRVTVPSFIVKTLRLSPGDELEWEIESLEEKRVKVKVVKPKKERPEL